MKRNRIVINLDDPNLPRRPKRRGGWQRPLLVIAVLLLAIGVGLIAGGFFWWRHYQSGPGYALALLVDALHRNDNATVDSLLDTDKISADFVSQVREKTTAAIPSSILSSPGDQAQNAISGRLKENIREQVIRELRDLTDVAARKPFVVVALAIPFFADIDRDNNVARANVKIKNEQIKITLQSENNRWRIVAVQDERLARMVADSIIKSLPTTGSRLQDEMRKQLDKLQNR